MNGFYILLLILLKTFLVPLPNDLIRFGVPGTINSVLSMAEFNAAFELFVDFQTFYRWFNRRANLAQKSCYLMKYNFEKYLKSIPFSKSFRISRNLFYAFYHFC